MDRETLADLMVWDEYDMGRAQLEVSALGGETPFVYFSEFDAPPRVVTDAMVLATQQVLALGPGTLETIKDCLWEYFVLSYGVADFGFQPAPGESRWQTYTRGMEAADRDAVWAAATLREVQVPASSETKGQPAAVLLVEEITNELLDILVHEGRITDWGENGANFGESIADPWFGARRTAETMRKALGDAEYEARMRDGGVEPR